MLCARQPKAALDIIRRSTGFRKSLKKMDSGKNNWIPAEKLCRNDEVCSSTV
jgi:hypothetical protein